MRLRRLLVAPFPFLLKGVVTWTVMFKRVKIKVKMKKEEG